MGIKLTYGGATFEVTTAREAADLFRLLRTEQSKPRESKAKDSSDNSSERTEDEKRRLAVKALTIIRDGGEKGVNSEQLATGLGLDDTRKLAHVANILRSFCRRRRLDPDTIFNRVETRHGRTWYPGKEIEKGIRAGKGAGTKESNLL